jgi:hypothetical protein
MLVGRKIIECVSSRIKKKRFTKYNGKIVPLFADHEAFLFLWNQFYKSPLLVRTQRIWARRRTNLGFISGKGWHPDQSWGPDSLLFLWG